MIMKNNSLLKKETQLSFPFDSLDIDVDTNLLTDCMIAIGCLNLLYGTNVLT